MKLKDTITQGMLEDFEGAIWGVSTDMGLAKFRGITARAAYEAGWFDGDCDLDNPQDIKAMSDLATEKYRELLTISPHDNGGGEARPQSDAEPAAG